jgi:hypothetical protein
MLSDMQASSRLSRQIDEASEASERVLDEHFISFLLRMSSKLPWYHDGFGPIHRN